MITKRFQGRVDTNISIDRINPKQGYTKKNVHLICDYINMAKRNLTIQEFRSWCNLIVGVENAKQITG